MKLSQRLLIVALAGIVLVGAALWGWNWQYRRYAWPKEIQTSVLGVQVVGSDEIMSSEGFSAYGEGMFRWIYRVSPEDFIPLAQYCNGQEVSACQFTRTKRLSDGVVQSVTYAEGVLTVEELWE